MDVAAGLHWLHSHRIVHFDVKSQNILLARDGTAKISDVGLARILHRSGLHHAACQQPRFTSLWLLYDSSARRASGSDPAEAL